MSNIKRVGVLTAGGDCPGLNAVVNGLVKTLKNQYDYEIIGFKDGFKGMVENDYIVLDKNAVSGIFSRGGTILGTSNTANPFRYPVEVNGKIEYKDVSDRAIENAERLNIECVVIIGGDGTFHMGNQFSKLGLNVIGVPKTIDNDLSETDRTFGFDTAVATAVDALDKLHTTAEAHHRVMVLEVMGRYAGWIAIESGIAGGADVILIPEAPYDINKIGKHIMKRKEDGKNFCIVVVAEGATPVDGGMVVKETIEGSTDPIRLGGVGAKVASDIAEVTGAETRSLVLGHLQRGGSPISTDRLLSTRYGVAAAHLVGKKEYSKMVALKGNKVVAVDLEGAIKSLKQVDPNGELVNVARSIGISLGI